MTTAPSRKVENKAARRGLSVVAVYKRFDTIILGTLGICLVLLAWQIAGSLIEDNTFISKPSLVWDAMLRQIHTGQLLRDTQTSLFELMIGFGLACLVSLPVGLAMGRYRLFEYIMDPYIWFFYCAPVIVFYPVLTVWFGLGGGTTIALTFLFATFPIIANTVAGVKQVDKSLIRAARAFGATELQVFTQVIIIASVPAIASGLRLGIGRALIGAIVGEFFGSNAGLGFRIALFGTDMRIADMFVPVVTVMAIGVITMQFVAIIEERVQVWRQ